ncbi:hypothetical protein [Moorena sp. SIO4G3]|nr:hypothetical protein [Moorena sp. SIO4G3]NEO77262.1 hypothetical protein [Moorena sp. SIO4G3]
MANGLSPCSLLPSPSDAARSWGGSAVLGRQRGLGEAARSWGFPPETKP